MAPRRPKKKARPSLRASAGPSPGSVFIVGAGRLGCGLAKAMTRADILVTGTWSPDPKTAASARRITGLPSASGRLPDRISHAETVFLTVPDDAIEKVCRDLVQEGLIGRGQDLVHCSGCLDLSVLRLGHVAGARVGSLHPLQAFADPKTSHRRFPGSLALIDADPPLARRLRHLAKALGMKPARLGRSDEHGTQRALYHAAAVMAAGGVVSVLDLAIEASTAAGLTREQSIEGLLALTRGALSNLEERRSAEEALTGPAARGDRKTVERHLLALESLSAEATSLYSSLSQRARSIAGRGTAGKGRTGGKAG